MVQKEADSKTESENPTCRTCGHTGPPETFPPAFSVYHDLQCPNCNSTNLNWDCGCYKGNTLVLPESDKGHNSEETPI